MIPPVFTTDNLKKYKAVVFSNSNNEGFDTDTQKEAFQTFVRGSGEVDYPGTQFGSRLPLSWYQEFDGGREYYTLFGYKQEHYSDPVLRKQILGGILWAIGAAKIR